MKKKLIIFVIVIIFFSYRLEKISLLYYIYKNNNEKNKEVYSEEEYKYIEEGKKKYFKNYCVAKVLRNNWNFIFINKGKKDININSSVEGINGFIGIVKEVYDDYSIVQTLWNSSFSLLVMGEKNNFGFIKNSGYNLILNSKDNFEDNEKIYIMCKNGVVLFGYVTKVINNSFFDKIFKKNKKAYVVKPVENIMQSNYVIVDSNKNNNK